MCVYRREKEINLSSNYISINEFSHTWKLAEFNWVAQKMLVAAYEIASSENLFFNRNFSTCAFVPIGKLCSVGINDDNVDRNGSGCDGENLQDIHHRQTTLFHRTAYTSREDKMEEQVKNRCRVEHLKRDVCCSVWNIQTRTLNNGSFQEIGTCCVDISLLSFSARHTKTVGSETFMLKIRTLSNMHSVQMDVICFARMEMTNSIRLLISSFRVA